MIVATLLDVKTMALDFDFSANTNATLKAIGGTWDKAAKVWTLPLRNLDKLIARCGDELMCDTEVWLSAPVKLPAQLGGTGKTPDAQPTRIDAIMADGLPRWAAQAERDKARKTQRHY